MGLNAPKGNEKVFQAWIFRCEMLVSRRVYIYLLVWFIPLGGWKKANNLLFFSNNPVIPEAIQIFHFIYLLILKYTPLILKYTPFIYANMCSVWLESPLPGFQSLFQDYGVHFYGKGNPCLFEALFAAVKILGHTQHMGVSKNRGTPKWMVKIMENPN